MQTLEQLLSGQLIGSTKIKLSCGLEKFPEELFSLCDTLEYLDLTGNQLSELPADMNRFTKLKILFLSENKFTAFPTSLSGCTSLEMTGFKANKISLIAEDALPASMRWLILTDNCIETLPHSIGNCVNMQKLMLAGNRLTELPESMTKMHKLELLRISANRLAHIPEWLFSLPRLSWLAFSGNTFNSSEHVGNPLRLIPWESLSIGELLGAGASGMIYKAHWKNDTGEDKDVAVKIFKGTVTSDGLPSDEMKACIAAGTHDNLVPLIGKIVGHPENKEGLVLELISSGYRNLGGPPDLKTCSRDTFPEDTSFSLAEIIRIAIEIANVCQHLRERGIMHGDLYAHNILINSEAHPLLSDFGAAGFLNYTNHFDAGAAEKLEVRAYGCLLDDLLTRIKKEEKNAAAFTSLNLLKESAMLPSSFARPTFAKITSMLENISSENLTK